MKIGDFTEKQTTQTHPIIRKSIRKQFISFLINIIPLTFNSYHLEFINSDEIIKEEIKEEEDEECLKNQLMQLNL